MKAILLTAGFGSRLRPLTDVLPKCLLPINGRPLLEYWFYTVANAGITSILMNLHYLAPVMKEWVALTQYAENVKMVFEEELLGTAGTLFQNLSFVSNEPVMLIHADNLCLTDMSAYINAHMNRPHGTEITMMTFRTLTPETCGIIRLDHLGIVQAFHEKVSDPPGNLANAAVYIIEPTVMEYLKSFNKSFIDFSTEVLPTYLGKIFTYHNASYHRDIGNLESYLAAQVEYPQVSSTPSERNNAWALLCEQNSGQLGRDILSALASALNVEVINAEELIADQTGSLIQEEKPVIIHCQGVKDRFEALLRYIEHNNLNKSNIILFFTKVPLGFSSRELYEKTRLRSLALYSSSK